MEDHSERERRVEPKCSYSFNKCFLSILYMPGAALGWELPDPASPLLYGHLLG